MHDPSPSQSLRRFGCFAGTLRPSCRQIRSTRLWFTHQPSARSRAVIQGSRNARIRWPSRRSASRAVAHRRQHSPSGGACSSPAPAPGMPGVRSPHRGRACHAHARPPDAASPGSEVELRTPSAARCSLTKDRLIEFGVRQEPLQPSVLLLEILQSLRLIRPQPAVLPLPREYVCSVTPSFRTTSGTVFPCANPTSASRSFPIICSAVNFFPRAISRPPLVCNHQRFSLWKWRRLRGAGQQPLAGSAQTVAAAEATVADASRGVMASEFLNGSERRSSGPLTPDGSSCRRSSRRRRPAR